MFEQRVAYATAGTAGREAMDRLVHAEVPPAALKVGAFLINQLASYSRLAEPVRIQKIADALGMARETVSKALKRLADLNVIGWRAGMARAQSWIALAHEYLPGAETAPVEDGAVDESARSHSTVIAVVTTGREVFDEKKTKDERETAPDSSRTYEPVEGPPVGTDEPLTPDETHDQDARFAADRLAMHLFNGLPDRWTMERMYRRFRSVPIGTCTRVLEAALRGRPSRTVDCPPAYAVAWIATAERKLENSFAA